MLKRLTLKYWPMALLLVLIVAVLCMSRYAENRKANYQNNAEAVGPKASVTQNNLSKGIQSTNKPEHSQSWIDTFTWPEGATAWALFLTLLVIAWQSVETHAAAEATVASVEAAKRQTDLIREQLDTQVQRERARLNLEVQPIEISEGGFEDWIILKSCIELTNSGHSNAFIKFGAVRFVLAGSGQRPLSEANPDDFTPFSNTIEPSKEPVYCPVQSDDIPLRIKDFSQDMADGTRSICLYGFVEYDTLGIRWHRDFGYVWKIAEPARVPPDPKSIVFRHPKDSEALHLTGWWEQDLNLKNVEHRINPN
jgi:hypothetical protein